MRADTTVIPANAACPTDSGLAAKAVGKLVRTVRRVQAAGGATGTTFVDSRRAAARRVREIVSKLRTRGKLSREESTQVIRRVTGEIADLAARTAAQAAAVVRNGHRAVAKALSGRMRGRLRRALAELAVTIERTASIVAQTRSRLAGQLPDSATRLVSLHDPDARPIRKGRIGRPVEFGCKAQVADNDGVILDYSVEYGAAPDGPQLAPAIQRVSCRAGRVPRAVTADRGYGLPAVERDLQALGVTTIVIPRQAKTSAAGKATERKRGFRRLVKWRTGSEGRISYLKRGYGWDRTRLDGRRGAAIWCGHGVFAHNLVKLLDRGGRRNTIFVRVRRDIDGVFPPVLVALRSQSRLMLEGRTRTVSGPSPDLASAGPTQPWRRRPARCDPHHPWRVMRARARRRRIWAIRAAGEQRGWSACQLLNMGRALRSLA